MKKLKHLLYHCASTTSLKTYSLSRNLRHIQTAGALWEKTHSDIYKETLQINKLTNAKALQL